MTDLYSQQLEQLKPMFPDVDDEVITGVLQAHGGNIDRSCDILVEMADPAYKPSESDAQRQKELEQDAALARRLAETELMQAHHPPPHPRYRNQHQLRVQPPQRRMSGSAPVSPAHTKKPSKIREIFKFRRSRSGSHDSARVRDARSEPPHALDAQVRPSHTLASDFSDSSDERRSQSSREGRPQEHRPQGSSQQYPQQYPPANYLSSEQPPQQQQQYPPANYMEQEQHQPPQPPAAKPTNDVFGLFDDSNLDSFTPLSPSKMESHNAAATSSQTNNNIGAHYQDAPVFANNGQALVDLDHPFDDNPLLHSGPESPAVQARNQSPPLSPSTNPFADLSQPAAESAPVDNNPFRNRQQA
ncbi:hypothetical protein IWW50_002701 [Coemansia erecta]|nr:hypothetical protein IWW50_002701 [Coemansia erecta]